MSLIGSRHDPEPVWGRATGGKRNLTRAGSMPPSSCGPLPPLDPLPDDHAAAAAFWWRILDQLSPQTPNQDVARPRGGPAGETQDHEAI